MGVAAFVYPGQGSQYVGMGKDLYEQHPLAKELFQKADDILGISLSSICFNGRKKSYDGRKIHNRRSFYTALF